MSSTPTLYFSCGKSEGQDHRQAAGRKEGKRTEGGEEDEGNYRGHTDLHNNSCMSVLTASVVLVGLYILCRCLIPRLVRSNSTLALLWYDIVLEMTLDLLTRTTRPQRLLQAVSINAVKGDPESVITAIDHFCKHTEWAMNVGDEKGAILDSVVMERSPTTVLELGTYCGYSAVRITRLLPPATRLITVEMNPKYAHVARQVIEHAGLQDKVCVLEGLSTDLIPKMANMFGIHSFDFIFLDHWKDRYLPDIRLLEDCSLLAQGSVVLADNVVCPGAPDYLDYIRSSLNYSSSFYQAHLEYTRVPDGLERSEFIGHRQGERQVVRDTHQQRDRQVNRQGVTGRERETDIKRQTECDR